MSVIKDETVFRKIKNIVEQRSLPPDYSLMKTEMLPLESRIVFTHNNRLVGAIVIERRLLRIVSYLNDLDEYFEGLAELAEIELNTDCLNKWGDIKVILT